MLAISQDFLPVMVLECCKQVKEASVLVGQPRVLKTFCAKLCYRRKLFICVLYLEWIVRICNCGTTRAPEFSFPQKTELQIFAKLRRAHPHTTFCPNVQWYQQTVVMCLIALCAWEWNKFQKEWNSVCAWGQDRFEHNRYWLLSKKIAFQFFASLPPPHGKTALVRAWNISSFTELSARTVGYRQVLEGYCSR